MKGNPIISCKEILFSVEKKSNSYLEGNSILTWTTNAICLLDEQPHVQTPLDHGEGEGEAEGELLGGGQTLHREEDLDSGQELVMVCGHIGTV